MNVGWNLVTVAAAPEVGAAYLIAVWLVGFDTVVRARYVASTRHAFVSVLALLASAIRRAGTSPATT